MAHSANSNTITRNIAPLSLRAEFRPGSVDTEKRTVEVIWTTGARVLRGFWDRFYEELSLDPRHVRMGRLESGRAPLLDSHDQYSGTRAVIGVVESARLEAERGVAVVRFPKAEDDPESDKIFRKVADGILTNVSVGYRVYRYEKVADGEDQIPVMRATDWEPHELSFVAVPADAGAGTRSADVGEALPCVFAFHEERKMENTETPVAPAAQTPADNKPTPPSTEDATRAAVEAAIRAERERMIGIRQSVRAAKLGDELAEELIGNGIPLDKARAIVLDKLATADEQIRTEQYTSIVPGEDETDKFARHAEAAILERSGMARMVEAASKTSIGRHLPATVTDPGEMRSWRLERLASEILERRGVSVRGMSTERVFAEAFKSRGMNSTSDFPILLETAMNKVLLAAYATAPDTWRDFCAVKSVSDFRSQNLYRSGSFGTLDKVGEGGEYKNKSIPDGEKASISVETYGNIIAITRKALVNDDLGAFMDLASQFGRSAALTIESSVYALLLANSGLGPTQSDSQPLFHSNRKNVGTGSAISVDAIDADAALMAAQKDPSNNLTLDLRPSILLVPRGLLGTAQLINDAAYDPSASNKFQLPNRCRGMFSKVIGTHRLSGTRRYLLADPAIAPVIAVSFLNGQQAPEVEKNENVWRVDGTEIKVRLDFGADVIDYRGAVTNAGAA
jgi:hypothetical protein